MGKFVALHKEQHTIMEVFTDYGYSKIDNGTKICHFLQGINRNELETAVNVVQAQPEKYGPDFDATVIYLGKMVTKKNSLMQFIHIAKTRNQPGKPKVTTFMGKIEF